LSKWQAPNKVFQSRFLYFEISIMKFKISLKLFYPAFFFLFFVLHLSEPAATRANMADPAHGGATGAEPSGLEQVFINRETLNIDLRSLDGTAEQIVLVEAIYDVENNGAEKKLELVFAFGSGFKDFQIWVDDQEIDSQSLASQNSPPSWKPPLRTPWLNGQTFGYAAATRSRFSHVSQGFSVVLPAGKHRLKARYKAFPSYLDSSPLKYWQFAYILAPARQWAGFGGLDVTINVPPGWTVVTTPELKPEGEALKGHFAQIPADALALTAQAPLPVFYRALNIFFHGLWALALFATPVFITIFAWKKGFRIKLSWLVGIGLSALWTLLIIGTGFLAAVGADYAIPRDQFSSSGYTGIFHIFGSLLAGAAAFFIGIAVWLLTVYFARKKKGTKNPA
jgi:hypothetical protein